jgi:hypothetical protein
MWMYPVPSCPDHTSTEELCTVEVDSRIHMVLDLGLHLNPGAGPVPLWRGVTSARVSMIGPVSVAFVTLPFFCARDLVQGLGGSCGESWDADLIEDTIEREAKCSSDQGMCV